MDMKVHYTSITIAAILRSATTQASLELALAPTMSLRAQVAGDFDLTTLKSLRGDVIFLDVDTTNSRQMRTLALFMSEAETGSVVVTSANLDVASMREFMRLGLIDVLPQPFIGEDVANALQAAAGRRHVVAATPINDDERHRGSVVSFIKSGGGVGATSLAVQGAAAVSREKNAPPLCVLDFDIQFGSAALQMDTEQRVSVIDLARDLKRLDGALLRSAMVRPHQRFDLLAAPSSIYPISDLDVDAVATILEVARREYSQVIVDLPTLWSDWVLATLANSDVIGTGGQPYGAVAASGEASDRDATDRASRSHSAICGGESYRVRFFWLERHSPQQRGEGSGPQNRPYHSGRSGDARGSRCRPAAERGPRRKCAGKEAPFDGPGDRSKSKRDAH